MIVTEAIVRTRLPLKQAGQIPLVSSQVPAASGRVFFWGGRGGLCPVIPPHTREHAQGAVRSQCGQLSSLNFPRLSPTPKSVLVWKRREKGKQLTRRKSLVSAHLPLLSLLCLLLPR